jgi:hypothetical protein
MILYADVFSYGHAACPDPITFSHYTSVNIYEQTNAFKYNGPFKSTNTPAQRDQYDGTSIKPITAYGDVTATFQEVNQRELALGSHGRSCGQWDIWEAVFGPVDHKTGFTKRLYNKSTGVIDKSVAAYWKEHFDLAHIATSKWGTLESKLKDKLHIFVGNIL